MNVLLVEDEPALLDTLIQGLELSFPTFKIEGVRSAEEGEALIAGGFEPRLIISDVRLPGKTGIDLLLALQDELKETQFILISGYGPPSGLSQINHEQVLRFLPKPFELPTLVSEVQSIFVRDQFSGNHARITFVDILQMLNMAKRTARVEITYKESGDEGEIFMVEGEPHDARLGDIAGEEAFLALCGRPDGAFKVQSDRRSSQHTIQRPFGFLLMDALGDESEEMDADPSLIDDPAELRVALDEICLRMVGELPEAVGAAVLDLAVGSVLGRCMDRDLEPQAVQAVAASAGQIFAGAASIRHATLDDETFTGMEHPSEIQLRLGAYCHYLVRIGRGHAVWLVLEGAAGAGWSVLRNTIPSIRPLIGL